MSVPSPHRFRLGAEAAGRDRDTIDRALEVDAEVTAKGSETVFTLNHLAELTGASWGYLRAIVERRHDAYLEIDRPKKDGRSRAISSPEPVLMEVQRWILSNILNSRRAHHASYAYQPGRSILDCASKHLGARWLVKLDLHNFFHSVRERAVFPVFADIGYTPLLSLELTRLCTRLGPGAISHRDWQRYAAAPYVGGFEGRLPQGAPTSGMLANLAMREIDRRLAILSQDEGVTYTRYSDDLVFSAADRFSRKDASRLIARAGTILQNRQYVLHRKKIRVVPPGSRQIVLGLLLTDSGVRLLPEFKRRIEVHIRGVEKFGLAEHARHRNFDSVLSFVNHVDGCIAFAASVEERFADEAGHGWETALTKSGYPRLKPASEHI